MKPKCLTKEGLLKKKRAVPVSSMSIEKILDLEDQYSTTVGSTTGLLAKRPKKMKRSRRSAQRAKVS